ncbi:MAG: MFS transporter [Actinomycetota bacterium]
MQHTIDQPARARSAFLLVAAGSIITSIMLGARSTFGLYLEPITDALSTDRGTFALAIAIQNLVWGLTQPLFGAIADRFGTARVLGVGAVGYTASMLLLGSAESTGLLVVSAGFLIGVATGAASFAVVLSAVGRLVAPERRSLALGVVTAMGSVGQFVLVPVAGGLLDAYGWRTTVGVIGSLALLVILCAGPLRGNSPQQLAAMAAGRSAEDPASEAETGAGYPLADDLRRASRHTPYLLLNMAFFVCGFHVTFIGVHLPAYVTDLGLESRVTLFGLEAGVAAFALSLIGLFNIFGSLTAGALGSRYSRTRLLAGIYGLRAVVISLFLLLPISTATTLAFGAGIGLLWLSTVPLTGAIVSSQFGPQNSGTLFGIVFLSHQLGAFIGVWSGGELFDATGSYRLVWLLAIALGVMAAVVHLLIDEGPAPAPPAAAGGGLPRLAPTGAAVLLVVVGLWALTLRPAPAEAAASAAADGGGAGTPTVLFCPLGGVHGG